MWETGAVVLCCVSSQSVASKARLAVWIPMRGSPVTRGHDTVTRTGKHRLRQQGALFTSRRLTPDSTLRYTPRNHIQETAFLVQIVLTLRFLVFDFGVYPHRDPRLRLAQPALRQPQTRTQRRHSSGSNLKLASHWQCGPAESRHCGNCISGGANGTEKGGHGAGNMIQVDSTSLGAPGWEMPCQAAS
eukprot:2576038-Rhodomonas_salina.2